MLSGNTEKINSESASSKLSCLGITRDKLTGRAGLQLDLIWVPENRGPEVQLK